jgi:hypothetical protein
MVKKYQTADGQSLSPDYDNNPKPKKQVKSNLSKHFGGVRGNGFGFFKAARLLKD